MFLTLEGQSGKLWCPPAPCPTEPHELTDQPTDTQPYEMQQRTGQKTRGPQTERKQHRSQAVLTWDLRRRAQSWGPCIPPSSQPKGNIQLGRDRAECEHDPHSQGKGLAVGKPLLDAALASNGHLGLCGPSHWVVLVCLCSHVSPADSPGAQPFADGQSERHWARAPVTAPAHPWETSYRKELPAKKAPSQAYRTPPLPPCSQHGLPSTLPLEHLASNEGTRMLSELH